MIQEQVKKPLAEELLFGKLVKGGLAKDSVGKETDKLAFAFEEAAGPARPARSKTVTCRQKGRSGERPFCWGA